MLEVNCKLICFLISERVGRNVGGEQKSALHLLAEQAMKHGSDVSPAISGTFT
jgi:hypothetical protein